MHLHYATHRCLIEPLSREKHIKLVLIQRFVSFMEQIEKSGKSALKMLKHEAIKDVRSTTGTNFRGIMLLLGDMSIANVSVQNIKNLTYRPFNMEEEWRILMAMELNDILNGDADVEGFEQEELEEMFKFLCIS